LPDGLMKYAKNERARAMTYTEYRAIGRDTLLRIVASFPGTKKALLRRALFIAFSRHLIACAAEEKKREAELNRHAGGDDVEPRRRDFLDYVFLAVSNEADQKADVARAADAVNEGRRHAEGEGPMMERVGDLANRVGVIDGRLDRIDKKIDRLTTAVERLLVPNHSLQGTRVKVPLRRRRSEKDSESSRSRSPNGHRRPSAGTAEGAPARCASAGGWAAASE